MADKTVIKKKEEYNLYVAGNSNHPHRHSHRSIRGMEGVRSRRCLQERGNDLSRMQPVRSVQEKAGCQKREKLLFLTNGRGATARCNGK
ncbi:hypothetical protein [Parabacteroides sp. Marseille-P3160]|uniref:hypothetical protein n=1 Tax=Parabacteroides sp. Marseille-P3160 TaxID=1917887 RepID=UPI00111AAFF0|nr:hypothetical protein [Parabacteroides sp. Marseille-P3160]